jgi:hypothetical protein
MLRLNDDLKPLEDITPLIGDLIVTIRRDMGFPRTSLKIQDFKGKLVEIKK